ncbi:MAG: hypothetical protein IPM79_32590 [Polyangiaceae bacterium]|nr:hypothetical protein [Polyangiaceae bacterium]
MNPAANRSIVAHVACGDHRVGEVERGGDDEGIDGVFGLELDPGEQVAGAPGDTLGKLCHTDTLHRENAVHGCVELRTPADLCEHGCGHANDRAVVTRDLQHRAHAKSESPALARARERVQRF